MLEEATKCSRIFMHSGKQYVCLMRLHEKRSEEEIRNALNFFTGDIYQVPPIRASVSRRVRIRTIYRVELLEIDGKDVLFIIDCSAGTYIRKYCYDIGLYLGCGAHMQELRRTRVGSLTEDEAATLPEIYKAYIEWKENKEEKYIREIVKPIEYSLKIIPKVYVLDSAVDAICHGASVAVGGISMLENNINKGDMVAILTLKGELIALGNALMTTNEILEKSSGLAIKTDRVIMKPNTYPRLWKKKH